MADGDTVAKAAVEASTVQLRGARHALQFAAESEERLATMDFGTPSRPGTGKSTEAVESLVNMHAFEEALADAIEQAHTLNALFDTLHHTIEVLTEHAETDAPTKHSEAIQQRAVEALELAEQLQNSEESLQLAIDAADERATHGLQALHGNWSAVAISEEHKESVRNTLHQLDKVTAENATQILDRVHSVERTQEELKDKVLEDHHYRERQEAAKRAEEARLLAEREAAERAVAEAHARMLAGEEAKRVAAEEVRVAAEKEAARIAAGIEEVMNVLLLLGQEITVVATEILDEAKAEARAEVARVAAEEEAARVVAAEAARIAAEEESARQERLRQEQWAGR